VWCNLVLQHCCLSSVYVSTFLKPTHKARYLLPLQEGGFKPTLVSCMYQIFWGWDTYIYVYHPASLAVLEKRRWLCYNKHLQFLCFKKQEIIEFRKFHAGNICRLWQLVHGPTFYMNAIQLWPTSSILRPLLEKHQTLWEYQMQAKLGICVEVAKLMRLECLWKLNNHVFWF
jgi:hypothetical protein